MPHDCKRDDEQKQIGSSIISMIKHVSWSLHLINDEELVKDGNTQDESWISDMVQGRERGETVILSMGCRKEEPVEETNIQDESWIADMMQAKERGEKVILSMGCHKEEPEDEFEVINQFYNGFGFSKHEKQTYLEWGTKSRSQTGTKRSTEKSRAKTERNITLQVLQKYFPGSLKDAAKSIGVCPTTLKRICRQHGIMRWPSRKIKKVSHSLKKLQLVIDSVQGADGTIKLGSFYTNFPELNSRLSSTPKPKVNERVTLLKAQTPSNYSSSCSRDSSSSSGNAENAHGSPNRKLPSYNNMKDLLSTPNDKLVDDRQSPEVILPTTKSNGPNDEGIFRVKATYGDEKIRFRMSKNWGFEDLHREISRRFNIYDMRNITLEYIDDDSEMVLLACDDDVDECLDLHTSTKNQTIKLLVHESSHPSFMPMVHPEDDIHMW
ncbi:hypothetical protein L1887_35047 [Cichorium endivia]|nr:hypothetical protein L1887_35047 [Cichorium endivia]